MIGEKEGHGVNGLRRCCARSCIISGPKRNLNALPPTYASFPWMDFVYGMVLFF